MIYLLLAILSSTVISLLMRTSEKFIKNNMIMFIWNYVICLFLSIFFKGKWILDLKENGISFTIFLG